MLQATGYPAEIADFYSDLSWILSSFPLFRAFLPPPPPLPPLFAPATQARYWLLR